MPPKPRRALAETFDPLSSPEARAFVQAGTLAGNTPGTRAPINPDQDGEHSYAGENRPPQNPTGPAAHLKPDGMASAPALPPTQIAVTAGDDPLVTVTLRLPTTLVAQLLRASADRKIRRARPWTQQDIAAEALDRWLRTQSSAD